MVLRRDVQSLVTPPESPPLQGNLRATHRRNLGRKAVRRDRAKAYMELFKLRIQLRKEKRVKEKYKKRCYRQKNKDQSHKNKLLNEVHGIIKRKEHRKALLVSQAIIKRIRSRYMLTKNQKEKKMIASLVCSYKLLKKLRLAEYARKKLGFTTHCFNRNKEDGVTERMKSNAPSIIKEKVVTFLNRDDNSRFKPGKKSTITRKGEKRQIRLLTDDLTNLHAKFLVEGTCKLSYSLFCSLRPFNIVKPSANDRDTCQCRIHENLKFKMETCHKIKVLPSKSIDAALTGITCDVNNKACMYRECSSCHTKKLDFDLRESFKQVSWIEWKTKRQEWEKKVNGELKTSVANITVKEREYGTIQTLSEELTKDLERASRHIFNINNQYKELRYLKNKLTTDELMLHIDFSENYNCKYSEEIQSMHFGASHRQISLHTGVAYSSSKIYSFCTVSDSLKHAPAAIWAHLQPVFGYLKELEPDVKVIHFISDGPTTQYRNKQNFYLFANKIFQYGFKEGTWNFLEAGHGKGAADGIGAVIKRTADRLVNVQGKDIVNAEGLLTELGKVNTNVKLFLIKEEAIDKLESELPSDLRPLSKTMQIHQVLTTSPGELRHRVLSCFCQKPATCECFGVTVTTFPTEKTQRDGGQQVLQTTADGFEEAGEQASLVKIGVVDESLVSKYCVVRYDDRPYPGLILAVDDDEDLEVKVMHCIGKNRFFWPSMDDAVWYRKEDIVTLLNEKPKPVTKRHCEINRQVWSLIELEMDLD